VHKTFKAGLWIYGKFVLISVGYVCKDLHSYCGELWGQSNQGGVLHQSRIVLDLVPVDSHPRLWRLRPLLHGKQQYASAESGYWPR